MNHSDDITRFLEFSSIRNGMDAIEEATEFYFTAQRRDAAHNLAIALHNLGYHVYKVNSPDETGSCWLVTGWMKKVPVKQRTLEKWLKEMHRLADRHGCAFESFGFLVECEKPLSINQQAAKFIKRIRDSIERI